MITYAQAVISLVGDKFIGGPTDGPVDEIKFTKGTTPPTEKAIADKLKELEKQYADNEYQRKRLEEYNAIGLGEQLDMIYHDIDGWKARIKSVKDKFPKP
ncbi:hypothetical protein [uncultured Mediterranean phage uvMED]|nr:hypothetical protein [uncultured Mediterranean phage uvMED]